MKAVLLVHLGATMFLAGVIWIVQIVHYPLFAGVGDEGFAHYTTEHARRISFVVVPAMFLELGTAIALAVRPGGIGASAYVGLGLVVGVWASTFLVQVPLHTKLGSGFDPAVHAQLVLTNWIRTALWSLRAGLVLSWVYGMLGDVR